MSMSDRCSRKQNQFKSLQATQPGVFHVAAETGHPAPMLP